MVYQPFSYLLDIKFNWCKWLISINSTSRTISGSQTIVPTREHAHKHTQIGTNESFKLKQIDTNKNLANTYVVLVSLLLTLNICHTFFSVSFIDLEQPSVCWKLHLQLPLRKKCPNMEFSLVRIFLYSDWTKENTDQKKLRIWTLFTQCANQSDANGLSLKV